MKEGKQMRLRAREEGERGKEAWVAHSREREEGGEDLE